MSQLKIPQGVTNFTGEGFKGERALAVIAIGLTIFSTILLIDLTIMQRRHTAMELEKFKREDEEKKNNKKT